jgi:Tfp pilus assembly protein PilF
MCHLKKGENDTAADYFQKVVDYYPKQKRLVKKAQTQLEKILPVNDIIAKSFVIHYKAVDQSKDGLELLNKNYPKGVRTHHASRYRKNDEMIDSICTDNETGKDKIVAAINNSSELELVKVDSPAEVTMTQELSHDDDKQAGKGSFSGGGHAVRFKSSAPGNILKGLRIYGSRYGEYDVPKEDFLVWICDKNFDILKEFSFPYSHFKKRSIKRWVTLKTGKVKLPSEFIICVSFDPHNTKGIYVYHDAEGTGNSFTGLPGDEMKPFNKGDWMIRAITTTPGTPESSQASLQDLIDSAELSSTVIVPEGVYTEPIRIEKDIILQGSSRDGCVLEVTANEPAIMIDTAGKGSVKIDNLTIKWQLATSDKNTEYPMAIAVKDAKAKITNCVFRPLGNPQRSPVAIRSSGFTTMNIDNCDFEGFEYVICYGQGTSGVVSNCYIADCGHQGIICYSGANMKVVSNIITGSKYHAVRNTGGRLFMAQNLIVNNANRGVYLGNKSGQGEILENIISGNGTGIGGFARAKYKIHNNVIMNNSYSGISMEKSCSFKIGDNIFMKNERGWVMFDRGQQGGNTSYQNTFWKNKVDAENFAKTGNSIAEEPQFRDAENGDFTLTGGMANEAEHGLREPEKLWALWQKWQERKKGLGLSKTKLSTTTKADKLSAENLTSQGWKLWGQRKLAEAEEKFKEAIAKNPAAENAYQGLGWAQLNQGKKLNAKDSFEKCVKLNPKNSAALNGLGWIAYGRGDMDKAISWWEKAVKAQPGATASLSGLTQVYMEKKEYGKAIKYYQMWLRTEPNNKQAKEGLKKAKASNKN